MGRPPLPIGAHGKIRIYSQATGGYRARTMFRDSDGVTRPVERTGKSKAAAERALKEGLRARDDSASGELDGATRVSALLALWLEDVQRRRKGTTYDTYSLYARNHVGPALGELRAREVSVYRVDAFLRSCEARLSAHAVRSIRTVVSGAMGYAARHGAIGSNPVRDAGRIEGSPNSARALTRAERVDLLSKLDADSTAYRQDIPDLVRFMLGTGCRIGEAIALQDDAVGWSDDTVAIVANIVRVRGKGLLRHDGKTFAAQRMLPLPDFVMTTLRERRPLDVRDDSMIFHNTRGHGLGRLSWRDPQNTGARLRDALDRAGYEWVTSHVFRKTAATILDQAGLTARAIAGHIGHARPSITQDIYMDKRSAGREAADAFDAALGSEEASESWG